MKYNKYILLFVFIAFCFTECKKYPEGPLVSFGFKSNRITGTYVVELYKVNDIDSTSAFNSRPDIVQCGGHYVFENYHDEGPLLGGGCCEGKWELVNNKKDIAIKINGDIGPFVVSSGNELNWKILRLTKEDFWIETDYSGNNYYVKLKKNLRQ